VNGTSSWLSLGSVRARITAHSFAFVLGLSAVFVALGFSAGFVSDVLFDYGDVLRLVAGGFLILMGIVMLRLIPLPFLQREARVHFARKPGGYLGSSLVGVAFAAGWTPCIGPILAAILAVASTSGAASQGALLLGAYALGFAVPFMLAAQMLTSWRKLSRYAGLLEKVGGILLIVVGVVLLSNWITVLSPYLASLGSLEGVLVGAEPTFALAFAAGGLSFLSPCVLPILPSFLAYLTGMNAEELMAAS
jgi:cytochrome c-type biogenesis protein